MHRRRFLQSALLSAAASLPVSHTVNGAPYIDAENLGILPNGDDNTAALQTALTQAATQNLPLILGPGTYFATELDVPEGTYLKGVPHHTILSHIGAGPFVQARHVTHLRLEDLVIDGSKAGDSEAALMAFDFVQHLELDAIKFRASRQNGLELNRCSGIVHHCQFRDIGRAALFTNNAKALTIRDNHIDGAGDNGILIWRDQIGEDGTLVLNNHIANIDFKSGGNGQNGNGINIFRANNVIATNNQMTDCALSALRINKANNSIVANNQARRIGEVAFYAEFAFDGAQFAHNLIDEATVGVSVTNANHGGQMGIVTGNIVRNLRARSVTNPDAFGNGIAVESQAIVTNNLLHNIAGTALSVGWGEYRDNVIVKDNIIQQADIGIGISGAPGVKTARVERNHITGARITPIAYMLWKDITQKDIISAPKNDPLLILKDNLINQAS